ncbi:TonB-dependent receptor [Leptospira ellisii]|uniref:TonB-dependent receptor n=1 Tax=Leptospira ellisii TaxID=2023197 RepID=A0A2N0B7A6_9LEPT|nr:TonB-dependent receptor [Leptospira ellisii]MDV6234608.1 TonB-dependent receptor [Leptospira ellisii]PJZ92410.1 TonB-dependent receptor [Leptospira ellisii]PKA05259.1 TonB-dependent receptor [Leptospira ellisii]
MNRLAWLLISAIIYAGFSLTLSAQGSSGVRGKIVDADSGDPVFGATIVVRSLKKGTRTDFDGKYVLDLPPGTYQVEFQMIGYDTQSRSITVTPGQLVSQNIIFGLKTLDTVEVKGRGLENTESALLQIQRKAGSVSDGISEENIKKSPDSSAGDVIKRVTGVTIIGGKYVFVRGLGERYSNTLVNDSILPSPEPEKRIIPLDLFPSGLIKNMRVMKTFTPEDPGEFSGGLLKIETQEYPDQFTMKLGIGVGGNANTTGKKWETFNGGSLPNALGMVDSNQQLPSMVKGVPEYIPIEPGSRFGGLPPQAVSFMPFQFNTPYSADKTTASFDRSLNFSIGNTFKLNESGSRLGVLVGTSYNRRYRFYQESTARYFAGNLVDNGVRGGPNESKYLIPAQTQNSDIYGEEVLWGSNLNLAYEYTKGQQIYYKLLYTNQSDKEVRESRGTERIDNYDFISTANSFIARNIFNNTVGGDHAFNLFGDRPHKLEWNFNYAEASRDQPDLALQVWRKSEGALTNYTRLGNNPDGTRFFSTTNDTVRSFNVKYEIPFKQWDGLQSKFKFGTTYMTRFKDFRFREFGQKPNNANGALFDNYPVPGEVTFNPLFFAKGDRTFSERQVESNAYDAIQTLKAHFAQIDIPLMPKLRFLGGVRVEDNYQKNKTFALKDSVRLTNVDYGCRFNNEEERLLAINAKVCDQFNNGVGEFHKVNRLPSANFTWEFSKDMNLRLAYTETVTRPDLREMSPFGFSPYFGSDRVFGNPLLKQTYILNYDTRWEWYINNNDYIGVGAFFKQLSNPIELVGQPIAGALQFNFTYANARDAHIKGVEFDFRKSITDRLKFETNLFFINSRVQVLNYNDYLAINTGILDKNSTIAAYAPTNLSRRLQGQSDFVFNIKFDYFIDAKKIHAIGVYYNYFGDRIFAAGSDGSPDAIERAVGLTDVVYTFAKSENFTIKTAARNIFDTRYRVYQRDELFNEDRLFRSYRTGVSYSVSANMTF